MQISLRQRIKDATRPIHDQIDNHPVSLKALSPAVTVQEFISFLKTNYGFLRPIEDALAGFQQLPHQPRWPALLADLRALGVSEEEVEAIPVSKGIEPISSFGDAMGVAYVTEGSRMGGLVIAKHISSKLGLSPEKGLSFFLPESPKEIVAAFHGFVHRLDTFARCSCDERDALTGATRAFLSVRAWLDTARAF